MGRFFLFLLALFPLFGGLALSTQNFAKLVHYDARFLGSPLLDLATPFYSPFRYLSWFISYYKEAPDLFWDTCIPCILGLLLTICIFVFCRPEAELSSHGSARWAKPSELSKMDLKSAHGVVIGLNDGPFMTSMNEILAKLEDWKNNGMAAAEKSHDDSRMKVVNEIINNLAKIRSRNDTLRAELDSLQHELSQLTESDAYSRNLLSKQCEAKKRELVVNESAIARCEKVIEKRSEFKPQWGFGTFFLKLSCVIYDDFLWFYKHLPHDYLRDDSNKHLAVVAPTRSGKGVGLIIPTLLGGWTESCIVNDIKSENWGITAGYRKKMGQKVIKFEPTSDDGSTARWNPLDEIEIGKASEVSQAQNLAAIIADFEGKGGNGDHWVANAANVIMAVILHLKYAHLSDPKNYPDAPNLYTVAAFLKVSVDLKGTNAPAKQKAAHSESQKSENLSEEDQKRADAVLSELEELSVTPPSSNEDLTAAASENPVDHFLQENDYRREFFVIYTEKLNAYRKEKIGLEDDAKGFIQTIKELGTFPHVPEKGIQIPRWDSASGSYKTEVMKPEDLRKLYPDAISLNNPNYMYTHPIIMQAFMEIASKPENELGSIISTANTALKEYLDPVLAKNTSCSDFCINDLMNYRLPVTLYLVTPPSDLLRLAPIFRLFFEMMVRCHAKVIGTYHNGRVKSVYKHKCLFLMDEFSSLGNLKSFASTLSYIAGYGMKAFLINQGLPQITGIYGKDNQILMNCHLTIYYAPNDNDTGKYAEQKLGNKTILVKSKSENSTGGFFSRTSYSWSEQARALMTSDELMRMGDHEVIQATGFPPIFTTKIKYYQSNFFLDKLCDAPVVSDVIRESQVTKDSYPSRFALIEKTQTARWQKKQKKDRYSYLSTVSKSDLSKKPDTPTPKIDLVEKSYSFLHPVSSDSLFDPAKAGKTESHSPDAKKSSKVS